MEILLIGKNLLCILINCIYYNLYYGLLAEGLLNTQFHPIKSSIFMLELGLSQSLEDFGFNIDGISG